MTLPLLFDSVLFDLDGTLVATDRFWVQAARTGARRAFGELGLERAIPDSEAWMGLVGGDIEVGFQELFSDLAPDQVPRVREACVEEERRLLEGGGSVSMPGAEALLAELARRGVSMGIASNCSRDYLEHMLDALALRERCPAAYCLHSAGIDDKGDMIEHLLGDFGTRSAVFVGDRVGDRDAAWANGLPHVHCAFGFAARGEAVAAEATIQDLGELRERLLDRGRWIRSVLEGLGLFEARPGRSLAITGGPLCGKTLFARDAARLLTEAGIPAAVLAFEDYARPGVENPEALSSLEEAYDLPRLRREVLEPRAAGRSVGVGGTTLGSEGVLVVEGPRLADPALAGAFERSLLLRLDEGTLERRIRGRDLRLLGAGGMGPLEARLAAFELQGGTDGPARRVDRVLDADNPLGPKTPDSGGRAPGQGC